MLGNTFGDGRRTTGTDGRGQRHIEVQTLAAAGHRIGLEIHTGDEFTDGLRHLAQLGHDDTLARVEVEHDAGRGAHRRVNKAPLRHMHFQGRLLGDPGQPLGGVDDRVDGGPAAMRDRAPRQPLRRRRRELLLEERLLRNTIGPAFAGHGTARDVRQHGVGDGQVIVENVGLGRAGRRIEHLVGVCQPHPSELLHTSSIQAVARSWAILGYAVHLEGVSRLRTGQCASEGVQRH